MSYGFQQYVPLTREAILERVSQEDIFQLAFTETLDFSIGCKYIAPYREDKEAQCTFSFPDSGIIYFVDFANPYGKPHVDCFSLISLTYNLNYFDTLELINSRLKLGLGTNPEKLPIAEKRFNVEEVVRVVTPKEHKPIIHYEREFQYRDQLYWQPYGITSNNLKEDLVIPCEMYTTKSNSGVTFSVRPFDIMYAYTGFDNDRKKIYRPNSPRGKYKWLTNCTQNDIGSINSIPARGNILVITKSYKDCRVLRNQGIHSVWFQNEGMLPSPTILFNLVNRFDKVFVLFDNDSTGIIKGKLLVDLINSLVGYNKAKQIYLPVSLLLEGIKDSSDCYKIKGQGVLLDFLKEQKVLN